MAHRNCSSTKIHSSSYALNICDELYELLNVPPIKQRLLYDKVVKTIKSTNQRSKLIKPLRGRDLFLMEKYNLASSFHKKNNTIINKVIKTDIIMESQPTKNSITETKIFGIHYLYFVILVFALLIHVIKKLLWNEDG